MSGGLCRPKVSSEQLDLLLSFMEEHPEFAAGKQSIYSRFSASKLWRLLAERLNAAAADTGGARKSPDKWCRYWADIKYKARKKVAAGGALGDLTAPEERLHNIFNTCTRDCDRGVTRSNNNCEEERRQQADDDMRSEESTSAAADTNTLTTEELLAEAAMRSALAAEKQAEAVTQAVDLLRDLVTLLRDQRQPTAHVTHTQHTTHLEHTLQPQHPSHHHRL